MLVFKTDMDSDSASGLESFKIMKKFSFLPAHREWILLIPKRKSNGYHIKRPINFDDRQIKILNVFCEMKTLRHGIIGSNCVATNGGLRYDENM